jgi:hypothetical protein
MKTILRFIALSVLALLCTSILSLAQRRPTRTPASPKPTPTPSPATKPTETTKPADSPYLKDSLDLSVASLPPNFHGHNGFEIYQALTQRAKSSTKGEFETTDAFNERMKAEASKPLLGSLTQSSTFGFVVPAVDSLYDADQAILHVRANLRRDLRERVSFRLATVETQNDSYVATNSYGAQAVVKRRRGDFYDILVGEYERFPLTTYFDKEAERFSDEDRRRYPELIESMKRTAFAADLQMDASAAMKTKENMRLLLVCRLESPYTSEVEDLDVFSTPTIKEPYDYRFTKHMLHVKLLQIWVFDLTSGRIFAKQEPH